MEDGLEIIGAYIDFHQKANAKGYWIGCTACTDVHQSWTAKLQELEADEITASTRLVRQCEAGR
jgi:hypothetical protein